MFVARHLLISVLIVVTTVLTRAADWPQLQGPNGNRTAPDTGLNADWAVNPPTQAWKLDLSDGGYAGPCVVAGTVYIVDHAAKQDILRAISLADGKEAWRLAYPQSISSPFGGSNCTPTYDNGLLYIEARDGQVLCVDIAQQRIVWNVHLIKDLGGKLPEYEYNASVTVDGDAVLVQPGGPGHACAKLDTLTGKTLWVGGGDELTGYAPILVATFNGVKQYVCVGLNAIFAVAPDTGTQLWSVAASSTTNLSNATTPILLGENRLFVSTGFGRPCAVYDITPEGPKLVWKNSDITANSNQPVLVDGALYCTHGKNLVPGGELVCEDAATGKVRWSHPGMAEAGLVAVDGKLIALDGAKGTLTLIKLTQDGYQELGTLPGLGGQMHYTLPVVADGMLIVRNAKALAAYTLK
jgi:outer membrane protein assembly factor BamB